MNENDTKSKTVYYVESGEVGEDGVPIGKMFETLSEAQEYGKSVGAAQVVEMLITPAAPVEQVPVRAEGSRK